MPTCKPMIYIDKAWRIVGFETSLCAIFVANGANADFRMPNLVPEFAGLRKG